MLTQIPDSLDRRTLVSRALFWTIAAFVLGLVVKFTGGTYSPLGMVWLSLTIGSVILGAIATMPPPGFLASPRALNFLLGGCAAAFAVVEFIPERAPFSIAQVLFSWLCVSGFGLLLMRLCAIPLLKRALFPAFLVLQLSVAVLAVYGAHQEEKVGHRFAYRVRNDVQAFAEATASALTHGKNPYSVRMPNVMSRDLPFYPAHATDKNGRLPFGYPYTPLSALWSLPGYWMGDFRLAHALALIGAAFFLAYARPSTTSKLAATCFLLFPSSLFVLVMSWTEPVALFFLGATLFCALRAPRWLFVALGCLVASKQYTLFLLPLLPLLVADKARWRALLWQSLGVAAVLTLPMALWDVDGFYRSAVQMQFKQPFRADSLSYLVVVLRAGGPQLSPLFGFAALVGVLWWGARKAPRCASHWCGVGALAYLGFFALNKQAFANYYFWIFGLLMAAVAVALPSDSEELTQPVA